VAFLKFSTEKYFIEATLTFSQEKAQQKQKDSPLAAASNRHHPTNNSGKTTT
jgi:hypothetical protein